MRPYCLMLDGCPKCGHPVQFTGTKWNRLPESVSPTYKVFKCTYCNEQYYSYGVFPIIPRKEVEE